MRKKQRQWQKRDLLVSRATDIYRHVAHFKLTSHDESQLLQQRVYDTKEWKKLTIAERAYVHGYLDSYRMHVTEPMLDYGDWVTYDGDWVTMPGPVYVSRRHPHPTLTAAEVHYNSDPNRAGIYWWTPENPGSKIYFCSAMQCARES